MASDPRAQNGAREFGIPLTPDEFDDLMSRRWDNDLLEEVRAYGLVFPDEFAGVTINLRGSGVVVMFTDRVERHRRVLLNLIADSSLIEVRTGEWSLKQLGGFAQQVQAEREWFESNGLTLLQAVPGGVEENSVRVDFIGPSEASARVVEAHFGNPTWLDATWTPARWNGPRADLAIEVTDASGRPMANVECRLRPDGDDRSLHQEFIDSDGLWASDSAGVCLVRNVPAVAYRVSLHVILDNGHADPDPVTEISVLLPPDGAAVQVVVH